MKFLNALKSALIFLLVWFASLIFIGIIGDTLNITGSESKYSSVYGLCLLVLPVVIGRLALSIRRNRKANLKNAAFNTQRESPNVSQETSDTSFKQNHDEIQSKATSSPMKISNPFDAALSPDKYQNLRSFEEKWLEQHYDLNSIVGVESIPLRKNLRCPMTSGVTGKLYYYLRKKAYNHEDAGNIELALACMKKSVALVRYEDYYLPDECYPLVKMLARNGYLDEARKEKNIIDQYAQNFENQMGKETRTRNNTLASEFRTDLIIMDAHGCVCPECAKYQGRVYSLSGKSRKFPKVPDFYHTTGYVHKGCSHIFWPYIDGVNDPDLAYTLSVHPLKDKRYGRNIVTFSNRPFVDDRTEECKAEASIYRQEQAAKKAQQQYYEDHMIEIEYQKYLDSCTVKWLQENFPTKAPKNVTGFRRMRTQNTKNYQALKQCAAEKGKEI